MGARVHECIRDSLIGKLLWHWDTIYLDQSAHVWLIASMADGPDSDTQARGRVIGLLFRQSPSGRRRLVGTLVSMSIIHVAACLHAKVTISVLHHQARHHQ